MLRKLLVFVSLIVLIDFGIGLVLKKLVLTIDSGFYGVVNNAVQDTSKIFILGSSRAQNHYNSSLISKKTGLSCFNAGIGGQGILSNYAILKERLKRNKPDIVVLDIAPVIMIDSKQNEKLNKFSPFMGSYKAFDEVLIYSPNYKLANVIQTYKFNSSLYDMLFGLTTERKSDNYTPIEGKLKNVERQNESIIIDEDILSLQITFIEKMKRLCAQEDVVFVCVISPSFMKSTDVSELSKAYVEIIKHFSVKDFIMFDFYNMPAISDDDALFKDVNHLNAMGSNIYSDLFANEINNLSK
jgi:hypothetical protein